MIPTLGYPSRTAAAVALRKRGLRPAQIAAKIGGTSSNIAALLSNAGVARAPRRRPPARSDWITVRMALDVSKRLRPHADARKITVQELARRIVETVLNDDLVDSVLDDAEED